MDYGELVQAIVSKVAEAMGKGGQDPPVSKQTLIVLTQGDRDVCVGVADNPEITDYFDVRCAHAEEYASDVEGCAGLVLFGLTNEALARIDSGVCGTPYTCLLQRALLLGKPVWLLREEIELLAYEETSPYAKMMYEKLRRLIGYGATVCGCEELAGKLRGGAPAQTVCKADAPCPAGADFECKKRVVTEKDVICARAGKAPRMVVGAKTILTDLAREYAKTYGIEIVRG